MSVPRNASLAPSLQVAADTLGSSPGCNGGAEGCLCPAPRCTRTGDAVGGRPCPCRPLCPGRMSGKGSPLHAPARESLSPSRWTCHNSASCSAPGTPTLSEVPPSMPLAMPFMQATKTLHRRLCIAWQVASAGQELAMCCCHNHEIFNCEKTPCGTCAGQQRAGQGRSNTASHLRGGGASGRHHSLLQRQLIHNALPVELDVPQPQAPAGADAHLHHSPQPLIVSAIAAQICRPME